MNKNKTPKIVYIGERYDGWYAYFEDQNPEQGECITEGCHSRRYCESRIRAEMQDEPFELKDAPWC